MKTTGGFWFHMHRAYLHRVYNDRPGLVAVCTLDAACCLWNTGDYL